MPKDAYHSVLVCYRKEMTQVYSNGLPVAELGNSTGLSKITTKRHDLDAIIEELSVAIEYLSKIQIDLIQQVDAATKPKEKK